MFALFMQSRRGPSHIMHIGTYEKTPPELSDGVLFVFQINREVESDSAATTTSDQTTEAEQGHGSGRGNDIDVDRTVNE